MEDKKWYQNKKIIIIAVVALVAVVGLSVLAVAALGGSSSDLATVTTFPENDTTFRFVSDGNAYADEGLTFPAETTTSVTERTTEDDYYGYGYDDDYDDYYDEDDYYDDEDDYYDDEDDYYEDEDYYDDYDDEYDDYGESEDDEYEEW